MKMTFILQFHRIITGPIGQWLIRVIEDLQSKVLLKPWSAMRSDQAAQGFEQSHLENLHWRLHNLFEQFVPLLDCPHWEKRFLLISAPFFLILEHLNLNHNNVLNK